MYYTLEQVLKDSDETVRLTNALNWLDTESSSLLKKREDLKLYLLGQTIQKEDSKLVKQLEELDKRISELFNLKNEVGNMFSKFDRR